MPISKLLLAVVPALALLPATVRTNRGPAPLRTATLETVVEPPEEPRNTYWCVRHGQSTANVENIISSNPLIGSTKHELTALGKEQAHVAGADLWANLSELEVPLEDVVVYSSNFTRARETAQIAAYEMQRRAQIAAGDWEAPPLLQIGLLSDLRERDFGSLDALTAVHTLGNPAVHRARALRSRARWECSRAAYCQCRGRPLETGYHY